MNAVVFAGDGKVRVEDVPRPTLVEDDDAIVRVTLSSICGSDLHLLDGKTPGMRVGGVIGHEFVGVVEEAGPGLSALSEGDPVLGSFLIACGRCDACSAGRFNFCSTRRALGLGTLTGDLEGAQAEYVRVPHAGVNLRPLTGALAPLSEEQVLFGGDILATGFYAAHLADVSPDDVALVVGGGPIGLLTAGALRQRGARAVIADVDPARVEGARALGYEAIPSGDGVVERVADLTDGVMAAAAVDAVGSIPAFKTSMKLVREGGRVVVVGVYGAERFDFPMGRAWIRGLDIRFSGMANVHAHWDEALEAVRSGTLDPTGLISHRLPLERAEEGYDLFAQRIATKVVLLPQ